MTWVLDVEVESTPLSTTGGHTWAAARRLAAYLSAAAGQLGLERPGLQLLELGAGTGWLGCTVARNLHPTARVCLTEQAGGLDWLQHNVELNRQRGLPLAGVHVQPCDWLDYAGSGGAASTDAAAGSDGGGSRGAADSSTGCEQAEPTAGVVAAQAHKIHCDTDRMARGQQSPPPQQQQAEQRQELDSEQRRGGQRPQQASAGIAGSPFNGDGQQAGCGASVHLRETHWDFIIGSDLIYNEVRRVRGGRQRTVPHGAAPAGRQAGRHGKGAGASPLVCGRARKQHMPF